jgi:hypothetical protein
LLVLAVVLEVVRSAEAPDCCAVPDCGAAPDCGADTDCGASPDWPEGGTYIAGAVAPVPAQPASAAAAATASAHEAGERLIDSCITGPHFFGMRECTTPRDALYALVRPRRIPKTRYFALPSSLVHGKMLYKGATQGSIAGGVVPYSVNGKEYLAVTSGNISRLTWGTSGTPTLLVYGL